MIKESKNFLQNYNIVINSLNLGYSSDKFYERIIKKLNEDNTLTHDDLEYMIEWDDKVSQFHRIRFETIKYKQTFFLEIIQAYVLNIIALNVEKLSLIDKHINELGTQFKKWMDHRDTFQEYSDQKSKADRIYSHSSYFKAVAALMTAIGQPPRIPKPISYSFNFTGLQLLTTIPGNNYSSVQENTTPFTTNLSEYLKSLAIKEGITVKLEGQENLKYIYLNDNEHNVVNLFLPSHRSPVPDAMVLGYLGLPHYILFANLGSTIPDYKLIADRVALLPEVISVGKIKDNDNLKPYDKLIRSLKSKISPNVINYPQGFVPSTGEILSINPVFVEKLLTPLIYNGFFVKVIPISYEVGSEFLLDKPDHQRMEYTIKYGKPLEFEAVKTLVYLQLGSIINPELGLTQKIIDDLLSDKIHGNGPRYFDHYLLSHWYENITDHKELTFEEMIKRAEYRFGFNLK